METKNYKTWLFNNSYGERTIKDYVEIIASLPEIRNYEDLMNYIKSLKVKPQTINQRLVAIRSYYNYLKEQGEVTHNPAQKVIIKQAYPTFATLLKQDELNELYEHYPISTEVELRRKVLLGLLIYQGADLGTTKHLKVDHVVLDKTEIYLPSTSRMNSRRLILNSKQVLPLYKYLDGKTDYLFKNEKHLINQYEALKHHLRKQEKKVESIRQIRHSVITNWLSHYNKREVQYYCGHKHIGSTEKYERIDLEQMKDALKQYHLLG